MDEFVPDEQIADTVRGAIADFEENNERIAEFGDAIQDMPGQLGILLRQINHAYHEFCAVEQFGGTTVGEEARLTGVLREAMHTWRWLRAGERP